MACCKGVSKVCKGRMNERAKRASRFKMISAQASNISCTTDCSASAKSLLQSRLGSQVRIDFHQPVGSDHQADESIIELVNWRVLDGFLLDLHSGANRAKQIGLTQLDSSG